MANKNKGFQNNKALLLFVAASVIYIIEYLAPIPMIETDGMQFALLAIRTILILTAIYLLVRQSRETQNNTN